MGCDLLDLLQLPGDLAFHAAVHERVTEAEQLGDEGDVPHGWDTMAVQQCAKVSRADPLFSIGRWAVGPLSRVTAICAPHRRTGQVVEKAKPFQAFIPTAENPNVAARGLGSTRLWRLMAFRRQDSLWSDTPICST